MENSFKLTNFWQWQFTIYTFLLNRVQRCYLRKPGKYGWCYTKEVLSIIPFWMVFQCEPHVSKQDFHYNFEASNVFSTKFDRNLKLCFARLLSHHISFLSLKSRGVLDWGFCTRNCKFEMGYFTVEEEGRESDILHTFAKVYAIFDLLVCNVRHWSEAMCENLTAHVAKGSGTQSKF